MNNLSSSVDDLRKKYREIFEKSVEEIQTRVDEIKPDNLSGDVFDCYDAGSKGRQWQRQVLYMLENDISKEIYRKFQEILAYRNNFSCVGCATCCNLACSEFSPEELKQKAER